MICPKDMVQMHQWKQAGLGVAEEKLYETWEIKVCPSCGRIVQEGYYCRVLTLEEAEELKKQTYA